MAEPTVYIPNMHTYQVIYEIIELNELLLLGENKENSHTDFGEESDAQKEHLSLRDLKH